MGIEWFRDLSITVMGFAFALAVIIGIIVLLSLQRKVNALLRELKTASTVARGTVEMVHDSIEPIASVLGTLKSLRHGTGRETKSEKKHRR